MLHIKTVESGTLSLLKDLMEIPSLKPFSLVGGTALSLRYGHRSSVDLDLFYHEKFDNSLIEQELIEKFGTNYYSEGGHKNFGIFC